MPNARRRRSSTDDAHAVQRLFESHVDRLYRVGLRLCGSPADADDLVQETFLRAFRGWDRFRGEARPWTWLYAIAARVCTRQRRRRAGEPAHMLSLDELLPSTHDGVLADHDGPWEALIGREQRAALDEAISALPHHFRIPFVLKEIAELSIAEVAQVLELKQATVKTRLHRARLLLAKHLVATLPRRDGPSPDHARAVCLALLRGKQEALDRDLPFAVDGDLCARCRSLFLSLDLTRSACATLRSGHVPAELRSAIERDLADASS